MNCLQYKGYMLVPGKAPVHLIKGLKDITTVFDGENKEQLFKEITESLC